MRNSFGVKNERVKGLHYLEDFYLDPGSLDVVVNVLLWAVFHLVENAVEKFHRDFLIAMISEGLENAQNQ